MTRSPSRRTTRIAWLVAASMALFSCGGGGSSGSRVGTDTTPGQCSGNCAAPTVRLEISDVQTVIAQAVAEAQAQGVNATIAVVDRVGNVLGLFQMAPQQILIATRVDANNAPLIDGGLEGINLPNDGVDVAAALAKAVTGAFLSSEGNAFTTRTANQIVQENFNPGEDDQPSGPLFGVQFSQLPCSDFSQRFNGVGPDVGPKRSPLGLSADPGGLPLYKGGTAVGGVGVIADGRYGIDTVISDIDRDVDELIAMAATFGYASPLDRRADRITVDGKTFRFADVGFDNLASDPENAPPFSSLTPADGMLFALPGYFSGTIAAGTAFGEPESGIRPDGDVNYPGRDAFVFVDAANGLRYPPIDGTDAGTLGGASFAAAEVRALLDSALAVANRARAQIRRPLGTPARVTISVVDTNGAILGMARTRDAPVFGADVSLQKARTAALFSAAGTDVFLRDLPDALYIAPGRFSVIGDYVDALAAFTGIPTVLATGEFAFSDRAGGNLSRPFYPDGILDAQPGPLSKPRGEWSVFSSGLQLDLSINAVLQHVLFLLGAAPDVGQNCAGVALGGDLSLLPPTVTVPKAANGLQIFPGSVPVYRGNTLIGGIGVSGDGVDQDDMIAFLGLHNAGEALGGAINNAPPEIRADRLKPQGERLRYIQCPQAPFVDSDEQNVCAGK